MLRRILAVCTFYNAQRGYAFVTSEAGSQYFLHLSNFTQGQKPVIGSYISFVLGAPVRQGTKPQAVDARYATEEEIESLGRKAPVTPTTQVGDSR